MPCALLLDQLQKDQCRGLVSGLRLLKRPADAVATCAKCESCPEWPAIIWLSRAYDFAPALPIGSAAAPTLGVAADFDAPASLSVVATGAKSG